jgi:murein L,D-transpeptidase YcbB/YkuD
MRRFFSRLAPLVWVTAALVAPSCGDATVSPAAGNSGHSPAGRGASPQGRAAAAPPRAEVEAALQALLEVERHPLLTWPDITRFLPALMTAAADEQDGLFWLVDGVPHPALPGALESLANAGAQGLDPAEFDAAALAARSRAVRAAAVVSAEDLVLFDTAVSVSVIRLLSSVHQGRVDPRLVGFDVDVSAKRLDPLELLRSARDAPGGVAAVLERVRPQLPAYERLMAVLATYRALAAAGEPPKVPALPAGVKKITPGQRWEGAGALAARLRIFGDLPAGAPLPGSEDAVPVYGDAVVDAVKRFQARHALDSDGVIGPATIAAVNISLAARVRQIELAAERERWLPELSGQRLLLVNVPLFRMWAFGPGRADEPLSMNVVVGKAVDHATPVFISEMAYIVFRPYWNPPPGILRTEIIPHARRDPGYLASQDMEILAIGSPGSAALPATPENLHAVLAGRLLLRQRPGPKNSLGSAKFIFPNDENVYMHGSPARQLFSRARRDFSHGCIRVEDPVRLAEWLLLDDPAWSRARILAAIDGATPAQVNLKQKVTVILFYDTAYVDSKGVVYFADDYYGHDAKLVEALAHGFPYPRTR